jgi:hypothetical protein
MIILIIVFGNNFVRETTQKFFLAFYFSKNLVTLIKIITYE